jgi:putative Mn2+ efflux pump MntP
LVRCLLAAGYLALAGVGVEWLREVIAQDLGARRAAEQTSAILAYLLLTGAVALLVTNLGIDALNRGVRLAFRLFSLGYVAFAINTALIALDYRRENFIPTRLQWTNGVAGLGSLSQAVGYWLWSVADKPVLPTADP